MCLRMSMVQFSIMHVSMRMGVGMSGAAMQQPCTHQIHDQSQHRQRDGLPVVNGHRMHYAQG